MKPIQVGLLGIGTVGSGTFNVLKRNQQDIQGRAGRGIEITMVADLDVARAQSVVGPDVKVVNDARAVIANPDMPVVQLAIRLLQQGFRLKYHEHRLCMVPINRKETTK